MNKIATTVGVMLVVFAIICLAVGSIFIWQGASKYFMITNLAKEEKVTIGLTEGQVKNGEIVDSLAKMQQAAETIKEHRRGIAPTYGDLLGKDRFDPTNPKHTTYAQALNLENYLFVGSLAMGLTLVMMGIGAFMLMMGLALALIAITIFRMTKTQA